MKNKLISIIGPTCSGKSDLSIQIAKKINAEIISVDSRQVYKNLDIGSAKVIGKIDKKNWIRVSYNSKSKKIYPFISEKINHWMIDVVDPKNTIINVAQFQNLVYQIIDKLFIKNITPILVGGSALYMDAILNGYVFPKTNLKIRRVIEKYSDKRIYELLNKYDKISAKKNISNHRRLVRALESYMVNKKPLSSYKNIKPHFDFIMVGINYPRKKLYERIDNKVDDRIKDGMIDEVKNLLKYGVSHQKLQNFGLEYRFIDNYLQGKLTLADMTQKLKFKIHAFARRQLIWYRRNKNIIWIDYNKNLYNNSIKVINKFIYDRKN